MSYIDAATYNSLTGRDAAEATTNRLKMASRLLDARIGNYARLTSGTYKGFKLDLDSLTDYQKEAVQNWVAWMTAALYDNNDRPDTFASIKLGRFSVNENEADKDNNVPELVRYADMELRDARIINTHVRSSRLVIQNQSGNASCI